ncbi:MAG: ParB/RepB/Spo0J family partition protein [Gemmatimonadetes bacterium]|jgi:ParB family transcriptional regulator, chromosome partitioning protein|nr:ParB/RepB/Spo0J family partition protein [Gemmatimonadota bacterium]
MGKKPVLGKGINALIPEYPDSSAPGEDTRQVVQINVDEIEPNPFQARMDFDDEHIDELMRSIQEKGVIQPIAVNRVGQTYQIIAGERRWRASKKGGFETIPALVYEIDSQQELMELSLIENVQREDLNPVEEAEGYRSLITKCFLTQDEVAQKVGKNRSTIANLVRLLNLPHEIQDFLRKGQLQMGHSRALLGLEEDDDRLELARRAVAEKMTAREVEKAVNARRAGRDKTRRAPAKEEGADPHILDFEERLQHRFGTAVNIRRSPAKKGRIEVEFYDDTDLERILELLLDEGE